MILDKLMRYPILIFYYGFHSVDGFLRKMNFLPSFIRRQLIHSGRFPDYVELIREVSTILAYHTPKPHEKLVRPRCGMIH